MIVPIVWVTLNYFGYLDYLKTKSVDLRMQFRGEITQNLDQNQEDQVQVEGNLSLPRVPKVCYVNFDSATLARDDVGERPWDRAFFRGHLIGFDRKGMPGSLPSTLGLRPRACQAWFLRKILSAAMLRWANWY